MAFTARHNRGPQIGATSGKTEAAAAKKSGPYSQADIRRAFSGVMFFEKNHRYRFNKRYLTSVTTAISKYKQPFDAEFWSAYKCLQAADMLSGYDKSERLLFTADGSVTPADVEKMDLPTKPSELRAEWRAISKTATDRGTKIHGFIENYLLGKVNVGNVYEPMHHWLKERRHLQPVCVELIVAGEHIAGQMDALFYNYETETHHIYDWKTNKKFDQENPFDNMLSPLDDLPDCHHSHYSLQLSIYRRLLEAKGFKIDGQTIVHIDHDDNITEHHLPYLSSQADFIIKNPKGV